MKISTKGRYGIRLMLSLALHYDKGTLALKSIAREQDISEKYLEGIIKLLVKNKFLTGVRGKGGGYRLTKSPDLYTVGSILRVTELSLAPVSCLEPDAESCPRKAYCRTLPMWEGLNKVINDYLDKITLSDLMHQETPGDDYVI